MVVAEPTDLMRTPSTEFSAAYAEVDHCFLAGFFSHITRYATNAFLRAKLGETLTARDIAPLVFERREEAQAFLARHSGDADQGTEPDFLSSAAVPFGELLTRTAHDHDPPRINA